MNQELVGAVREKKAILFVGAGVSNVLGLPTFSGLVDHLAKELDYDPEIFSTHGNYRSLAEFYWLKNETIEPLVRWMDQTWHSRDNIAASEIHKLIVDLGFPIIYTTNYDNFLERAHQYHGKKYTKIADSADICRADGDSVQIVKFHGDLGNHTSIVLTESSYFERLDFEAPLDIKLRHDLLGKTVLFIGYSLADINIRYMLFRLNRQWRSSSADHRARPKSFVFLTRPNPVEEQILESRGVHSIVSDRDDPEQGLRSFLRELFNEAYCPG